MSKSSPKTPADAFLTFLRAIDEADWAGVRRQMAAEVETDYQSLFGGAPARAPADAIVDQWRTMLGPLDATQHLLGPIEQQVEGERAHLYAGVRGEHVAHGLPGGESWTVVGAYQAELERREGRWLLTRLRLDTAHQLGNRALLHEAGARARALPEIDHVRCERVRFTSMGERVTGQLFVPAELAPGEARRGVVVLGSWTTVKEQMASDYAQRLAQAGYVALCFDARGHGESAGAVRELESPQGKIEDVIAAARWLAQRDEVHGAAVGALGICAGAGYVAGAASRSAHIDSLALVAPWLHDAAAVRAIYGGEEGVSARLAAAVKARERYASEGVVEYVPAVSETDEQAAMYGPFGYYLDRSRGAVDAWPNRFATMGWSEWLEFDPHPFAAGIEQPTLLVSSREAALPEAAQRFVDAVPGATRAHWMPGTQFDFYDDAATLEGVLVELREHFGGAPS